MCSSDLKALAASVASTASVARQTGKALAAAVVPAGALNRLLARALSASVATAGALGRSTAKALAALIGLAGTVTGQPVSVTGPEIVAWVATLTLSRAVDAVLSKAHAAAHYIRRTRSDTQER